MRANQQLEEVRRLAVGLEEVLAGLLAVSMRSQGLTSPRADRALARPVGG